MTTIRCRTSCCPSLGSGSTLRGYSSWRFRDRHAVLLSGEWRWIPSRLALDMALFYDAGMVAPRLDAITLRLVRQQLRRRRAVPRPGQHAAPHRARARAARARGSSSRRARRSDHDHDPRDSIGGLGLCGLPAGRARRCPRARPRVSVDDDPLAREPETQDAVEGQRVGDRSDDRSRDQPLRPSRRSRAERARAQRQHDRRGARFELVHQPHPRAAGDARRARRAGR